MSSVPAVPTMPSPATSPHRPAARTGKVNDGLGLAYWLFVSLAVYNILNFGALYTQAFRGSAIPINPLMFALIAVPVFAFSRKPRERFAYFVTAWLFWIVYAFFGFFGPFDLTRHEPYVTLQEIFKHWISLVGIPILATRAVSEQRLPQYARIITILITIGSVFSIVQLFKPDAFEAIIAGGGRGAGLWINPNLCAAVCATGIIFSLMFPFKQGWLTVLVRTILLLGLASTLSRGGILASVAAFLVYGFMNQKWTVALRAVIILIVLGLVGFAALEPLTKSPLPALAKRAQDIQAMLKGDVGEQTAQGRWALWKGGFNAAKQHWVFGRGHGSMHIAVRTKFLEGLGRWHAIGPHNYYIFVLGNSGVFALLAFLLYLVNNLRLGYACRIKRIRGGLMSIMVLYMVLAIASHSLFSNQFLGLFIAVFVLAAHYGRKSRVAKPVRRPAFAPQAHPMARPA